MNSQLINLVFCIPDFEDVVLSLEQAKTSVKLTVKS